MDSWTWEEAVELSMGAGRTVRTYLRVHKDENAALAALLKSLSRKKDKSVSITFITTLEQPSQQLMELDEELQTSGHLFYKPSGSLNELELKELDKLDLEVNGKTRSQRLRGAIMVLHKKTGSIDKKEDFYVKYMEKFISYIVEKIPED